MYPAVPFALSIKHKKENIYTYIENSYVNSVIDSKIEIEIRLMAQPCCMCGFGGGRF